MWQDADVIIASEPLPAYRGSKTVVITPHAATLTLLFYRLRDTGSRTSNHMTQYEFYGHMADAVNRGLQERTGLDEHDTLKLAVTEAANVIRDWQDRVDRRF